MVKQKWINSIEQNKNKTLELNMNLLRKHENIINTLVSSYCSKTQPVNMVSNVKIQNKMFYVKEVGILCVVLFMQ